MGKMGEGEQEGQTFIYKWMVATHCGEYFLMYIVIKSLWCTPETNILYVNYSSINKFLKRMWSKPMLWDTCNSSEESPLICHQFVN